MPIIPMTAPLCLGVADATVYAQGVLLVRFYEMVCIEGIPYRYDFHVKRLVDGPLTLAEINAGDFYSCSLYQDQINPDLYVGSPFGTPGIGEVVLAIESPGDAGDNIHLFTNQQYQVAVRAVAIDGNVIAEDDNAEVAVSFSSGYQGIAHLDILSWPCLSLCSPALQVAIQGVVQAALSDVKVSQMPVLETMTRTRRK
jgi:hypothetical protein